MATNPATSTDLQNRSLRTLTVQESTVGSTLLEDAWAILITRIPGLPARLDAAGSEGLRAVVVQVLCAMVLRVLNNPDGKFKETIDDYSYQLDSAVSTGSLYLSDAEAALLADLADGASDGAWTIKPASSNRGLGYWSDTTTWVPIA